MCGIAGIMSLNGRPIEGGLGMAKAMANAMVRRGPNDEGYLLAYRSNRPAKALSPQELPAFQHQTADVFLAHRRLSILDLSALGHQPMISPDGRFHVVYNGEIYNFREIADELAGFGFAFSGHSDTAVLLAAYQQWGRRAFSKFNGMFALAIWDDKEKVLLCARDRIGIKPFFYTLQNNRFLFASDVKTLIASGAYQASYDLEGLYHVMSYGVAPRPMTAFKDVSSLEAGQLMWVSVDGKIHREKYWDIPINTQSQQMSEAQAVEQLEEKLRESVKRRLMADVPVGVFMSGGIDSTTVAALAAQEHPGIKAFTLAYESEVAKEFDEVEQAKETASMYNIDHVIHTVRPDVVLDHIDEVVRCQEEPFYSLSPNYIISDLVTRHNCTVVLNGLGGDELFAGYRRYQFAKFLPLLKLLGGCVGLLKRRGGVIEKIAGLRAAKTWDMLYSVYSSRMPEDLKQRLFLSGEVGHYNSVERLHELYASGIVFDDAIEAMSYMDIKHYIGCHQVYRSDQFTMHFSLEGRFPFLDHELVELAFSIPSRYKLNGLAQKYVLRKVAEKHIAPSCLSMKKKGFSVPMDFWLKGPLREYAKLHLDALGSRGLFAPKVISQIFEGFLAGKGDVNMVWQLVATERWLRLFFD